MHVSQLENETAGGTLTSKLLRHFADHISVRS